MAILGGGATTAHIETTLLSGGLVADDQLLKLGTTSDIVLVSRSTALSADDELSNVIEGSSDHLGVAANSLIISNVTNDGDIMLAISDGGNSKGLIKLNGADGTIDFLGNINLTGETTIATSSNDMHLKPAADIVAVGNAGGRLRLSGDSDGNDADMVGISWQENESNEAMTLYYNGSANELILKSQNVDPIMTFPRGAGTVINWTGVMIGANNNNNWLDDATHGSGSTTMYIGNETITTSSDSRVKEDIADTSIEAVELLDKLRVVDFTWNDVNDTSDYGKNYRGRYVGMVAQETIKHAPWIINDQGGGKDCPQCSIGNECDDHLPWHVEYQHLVPTLVKAVQELNKEISMLKGEV